MEKNNKFSIQRIAIIGLMSAMVFVATNFRIDIPTPLGKTMIHLGNVMCLLSGLLFGGINGGLAAGIGSAMFDLFDPTFAPEAWITFIMKFVMGYLAGKIAYSKGLKGEDKKVNTIAAIVGAGCYVILYTLKTFVVNYLIIGTELSAVLAVVVTKSSISAVNAIIAVICSLALSAMIRPALRSAGVFKKLESAR